MWSSCSSDGGSSVAQNAARPLGQHAFSLVRAQRQDRDRRLRRPQSPGLACHIARAETGGVKGQLGVRRIRVTPASPVVRSARSRSSANSRTVSASSTNTAASCSRSFRSCGFSTASAMCWFTWRTAIGLSRVALRIASALFPSWSGRNHRFELLGLVQEQILGGQHAHIGRNHIPGGKVDGVTRHQELERKFGFFAVPHHSARVLTMALSFSAALSARIS